jgi:hypothetical protein
VIDSRVKTAIEDKATVRSALGKSPDLAEALMLAPGEPPYEKIVYRPLRLDNLPVTPMTPVFDSRRSRTGGGVWGSCEAQDRLDDAAGDSTFIVHSGAQMRNAIDGPDRLRYGSLYRRKAW